MKRKLDDTKPIFMQIKDFIEDSIMDESFKTGDQVPSTNELASFYQINPATARKGMNELVDEEILVKRRGIGMFVTESAQEIVIEKRKQTFYENYLLPLKEEARKLRMKDEELIDMLQKEDDRNED